MTRNADPASIHTSARLEDAVAYRIHRTNRLLLTHLARFLRGLDHQLTPEKWFIVARLAEAGPVPQVELTEPALVDAPNVSRLVESLVQDGLVERHADADDRRVKLVALTGRGETFAAQALAAAIEERMRLFDGFNNARLTQLTAALDQLDETLRQVLLNT